MWTASGKQYLLGRGRKQESPAFGVSAVPMVTGGGGVSSSLGLRGFTLGREVAAVKGLWFWLQLYYLRGCTCPGKTNSTVYLCEIWEPAASEFKFPSPSLSRVS